MFLQNVAFTVVCMLIGFYAFSLIGMVVSFMLSVIICYRVQAG